MKSILHLGLAVVLCGILSLPARAADLTQRDWMVSLIDAAGWSFGLPDEPGDQDYINILSGKRTFRFEAEDIYAKQEDNVALMTFRNFGAFSGTGWLHGSREATDVHLRFTLPVDGTYLLRAQLRYPGHQFKVGEKVATVDAEQNFTEVEVGSYPLQAGPQEIIVTLPPGGSIDYISLSADNLPPIMPEGGWQPDEPLTWDVVQTTMLQLFQLADTFPVESDSLTIEAETLSGPELHVVDIPYLGHPSGGKWLRTGPLQASVTFPVKLKKSGFYDPSLRILGTPVAIKIGDYQTIRLDAKPYLDDYRLAPVFLPSGESKITVTLPPGGGIDWLSLDRRKITSSSAATLLGFSSGGAPSPQNIDSLTSLLAAFGVER